MNLKRLLVPLLGIFLALLTLLPVEATESRDLFEVKDVPNVQIGDSLRFVSDPSHFLDSSEVEELDNKLHQLRLNFGVDAALVVLPSIGNRTIDWAIRKPIVGCSSFLLWTSTRFLSPRATA